MLAAIAVILADTAGLRDTTDAIEAEGVRRARAWAEGADLRLWVIDGVRRRRQLARGRTTCPARRHLLVLTKADLTAGADRAAAEAWSDAASSIVRGIGDRGRAAWTAGCAACMLRAAEALSGADFPAVTRERHRRRLTEARDHLAAARAGARRSAELAGRGPAPGRPRAGPGHRPRSTSRTFSDEVFATFCIGK